MSGGAECTRGRTPRQLLKATLSSMQTRMKQRCSGAPPSCGVTACRHNRKHTRRQALPVAYASTLTLYLLDPPPTKVNVSDASVRNACKDHKNAFSTLSPSIRRCCSPAGEALEGRGRGLDVFVPRQHNQVLF